MLTVNMCMDTWYLDNRRRLRKDEIYCSTAPTWAAEDEMEDRMIIKKGSFEDGLAWAQLVCFVLYPIYPSFRSKLNVFFLLFFKF